MKINLTRLSLALVMITALGFGGCKKKPVVVPPTEVCNITHMKYSFGTSNFDATFSYNSLGNPSSVIVSTPGTGNPNAIFQYDQYNRLKDYFGPYQKVDPANLPAQFSYEFWTRYIYTDQNAASMPIGDTTRLLGIYNNGDLSVVTSATIINAYTYDLQNRIVKITASGNNSSQTFNYDVNGNLIIPNVTYDDKKNFRSTNKIWMLIDHNYSTNNPFIATTYNSDGLPLTLPVSTYPGFNADFLRRQMNISTIDYSCSVQSAAQ